MALAGELKEEDATKSSMAVSFVGTVRRSKTIEKARQTVKIFEFVIVETSRNHSYKFIYSGFAGAVAISRI